MGNKCTYYWKDGKWLLGSCLYLNEIRKMGYYAVQGWAGSPPEQPPTKEQLKPYERYQNDGSKR